MALAVLKTTATLDAGARTTEAAPRSVSPFAGKYEGHVPNVTAVVPWNVTISDSGGVKGSYSHRFKYVDRRDPFSEGTWTWTGAFAGSVNSTGRLEISGTQTFKFDPAIRTGDTTTSETTFACSASAVLDVNGDLVVTDIATGTSEVWMRQ
jgi:hypothetical protein